MTDDAPLFGAYAFVELRQIKLQIPVFPPYKIVMVYLELAEITQIAVFVVLRVRMVEQKSAKIYLADSVIRKMQLYRIILNVVSINKFYVVICFHCFFDLDVFGFFFAIG